MKNILYLLIIIIIFSCNNYDKVEDFNGDWIILSIEYKGKSTYPKTVSEHLQISFNLSGFEDAEKIEFQSKNSSVILPGFESDFLKGFYEISDEKLIISIDENNFTNNNKITKEIFSHEYEIFKGNQEGELILKSELTNITLFNENTAIKNRIDLIIK